MPILDELANAAPSGMSADLRAGIQQLSADEQFTFTLYQRLILPADGFVFYAPASTVTPPVTPPPAGLVFSTNGSLHVTQTVQQERDTNYTRQDVVFTTKTQAIDFAAMSPSQLYVLTLPNGAMAAFSAQRGRYDQAGIWHYSGKALFPFEASQFVATPDAISLGGTVVSNSMPFWLAMSTDDLPVYPDFLSPANLTPPFVSVEIRGTQGIGASPYLGKTLEQSQLVSETARFTFYGVRNDGVLDFQMALLENSFVGDYGVMNTPVPVDESRTQAEFGIKAQLKTMDLELNYYQARARDVARKLITSAFITITPA